MKFSAEKLIPGCLLGGAALLLAGCGTGGGYGEVDTDYYGPVYGGPVYYGHPRYHDDVYIARPPEHRFDHRGDDHRGEAAHPAPEQHHEEAHHDAPAPRPSSPPAGGGHEATTPEPRNQHP